MREHIGHVASEVYNEIKSCFVGEFVGVIVSYSRLFKHSMASDSQKIFS